MLAQTTILAYLAKALKGQGRQEAGDTQPRVPGLFTPVITPSEVFTFFHSVAPGISDVMKKSFIFYERKPMNADSNTPLLAVGPGLWTINWAHWFEASAAGDDITSFAELQGVLIETVNPGAVLSRFSNHRNHAGHINSREITVTIDSTQAFEFIHNVEGGALTQANNSNVSIIGIRRL